MLVQLLVVYSPFIKNQEIHVKKNHRHEDYLRQELEYEVKCTFEVLSVESFKNNSEQHLNNADNYREFHFEGVLEL